MRQKHPERFDREQIDFARIAKTALDSSVAVVQRWLPEGRRQANEWVIRNPKRADMNAGSFRINLLTGRWADFAIGVGGGDLISLAAYLFSIGQTEAAMRIADMLGVGHD